MQGASEPSRKPNVSRSFRPVPPAICLLRENGEESDIDRRLKQLNAPRLVRQRRYQELDMLGNLPGIMFGVLPGGVTADLFVHRKADQEPGPVVVAL